MRALVINLVLTGLWVVVTADASAFNALIGFIVGFALLTWLWPERAGRAYFTKVPAAFGFAGYFLWQLTKSALQVAWEVITPHSRRRPGIVAVLLEPHTDLEFTVLMNLVTLTPGTVVVVFSPHERRMLVHAMFADDPEAVRHQIKTGFERRVLELLR
jgi:multicomponent Na+:H+ antiporter subunit E